METVYTIESLKEAPKNSLKKLIVRLSWVGSNGKKRYKSVAFGHREYLHNYSETARKNYLTRSAGIRTKNGELTKNDPLSPNYWSRRVLWSSGEPWLLIQNPDIAIRETQVQTAIGRKSK